MHFQVNSWNSNRMRLNFVENSYKIDVFSRMPEPQWKRENVEFSTEPENSTTKQYTIFYQSKKIVPKVLSVCDFAPPKTKLELKTVTKNLSKYVFH